MKRLNFPLKLLLLLGGLTPTLAPAQLPLFYGALPTWSPSYVYDTGAHPRVSGGVAFCGTMEIHQPATWNPGLFERPSEWGYGIHAGSPQFWYTNGFLPSMGAGNFASANGSGSPNPLSPRYPYVVEVHQASQTGPCDLWYDLMTFPDYHQGVVSGCGAFDFGCHPSVAVQHDFVDETPGLELNTTVVEVHQDYEGWGTLYYSVGTVIPSPTPGSDKASIAWGPSQAFDTGANPCVTFLDSQTVMEVHQDGPAPAGLWCSIGKLNGSTIQWSPSTHYAFGANPSVSSVANYYDPYLYNIIVEVHQAAAGPSTLYCCFGYLWGTTAYWGTDPQGNAEPWALATCLPYGWGTNPSLDSTGSGSQLQEVHADADGQGSLYTTILSSQAPWQEP